MDRYPVAVVGELPEGGKKMIRIGAVDLGLFFTRGEFRAYRNFCPHAGAPVCYGAIREDEARRILRCPWHGWEFDLDTGVHLSNPACALERYPVDIEDGRVFVTLS